jgi:hypothetical protein
VFFGNVTRKQQFTQVSVNRIIYEKKKKKKVKKQNYHLKEWIRVMVFKATFNNISAISWRAVLLVEKTRVPRKNQRF